MMSMAVANPTEQAVIADIRPVRADRFTLKHIADTLTERGVATKTGKSRRWSYQAVGRIVKRLNFAP